MAHTAPVTTTPVTMQCSDIAYILTLPEKEHWSALCGLLDDGRLPSYDALAMILRQYSCIQLCTPLISRIALMIHRGDKRVTLEYITMISPLLKYSRQREVCALYGLIEKKYNPKPAAVADVVKLYMGKQGGEQYDLNPEKGINLRVFMATIPPNVFYKLPPSH